MVPKHDRISGGRVIIVGGAPRSGKTLIRNILAKEYGISGFGIDYLQYMLDQAAPQIGGAKEPMWPFIKALIDLTLKCHRGDYIIEGTAISPSSCVQYKNNPNVKICFLGFPTISVDQKIKEVKAFPSPNETEDWLLIKDETAIRKEVQDLITLSKSFQEECAEVGLPFIDISTDFEKKLKTVIDDLVK
jgi:hypothetical protein